jgi:hypothetical protein
MSVTVNKEDIKEYVQVQDELSDLVEKKFMEYENQANNFKDPIQDISEVNEHKQIISNIPLPTNEKSNQNEHWTIKYTVPEREEYKKHISEDKLFDILQEDIPDIVTDLETLEYLHKNSYTVYIKIHMNNTHIWLHGMFNQEYDYKYYIPNEFTFNDLCDYLESKHRKLEYQNKFVVKYGTESINETIKQLLELYKQLYPKKFNSKSFN